MAASGLAERLRRLRSEAGAGPGDVMSNPKSRSVPQPDAVSTVDAKSLQRDAGLRALLRRQLQKSSLAAGESSEAAGADRHPLETGHCVVADHTPSASGLESSERDDAAPVGVELAPGLFERIEQLDCAPPPPWLRLPDVSERLLPTDALLHFDTETTGLAGGAGTRAFMLGFARWNATGLELRQLWITRLGAEALMLERFAQCLSACAAQLVSYNGRSFDAPLLAARYRLCRMRDPLKGMPHHDLLHAVRRRYRGEWPNCRMGEAEQRLLGIERVDDLPGAEAPAAFLAALRQGQMGPLQRVQAHHRQDLISLAGLLPRLCQLASEAPHDWALRSPRGALAHV